MLRKKLKLTPLLIEEDDRHQIAEEILTKEKALSDELVKLRFDEPIRYVYNPLQYAYDVHAKYIRKYCNGRKKMMFLGINPGPNGMVQTGIPFGEITTVKEWFQIDGVVNKPDIECPKKPIRGLNIRVSEISGRRFWAYFRKLCIEPENFFVNSYVHNYCPLAFLKENGINVTPNELKVNNTNSRKVLERYCDEHLLEIVELLGIDVIIAVGRYAEKCCKKLLKSIKKEDVRLLYMHHPSPRAPSKIPWDVRAEQFLNDNELMHYFETR